MRKEPGDTDLRLSLVLFSFIALLTWISIRGSRPGFLFRSVYRNNIIHTDQPWSVDKFQDFIRAGPGVCGVGDEDPVWHAGHSIRNESVQLYRSLGFRYVEVVLKDSTARILDCL